MPIVAIADLFPSEPSVIRSVVTKLTKAYENTTHEVDKPEVALIDEHWLVVNGNNRVFAANEAGVTHIDVKDNTPSDATRVNDLRSRLQYAIQHNQQGFQNVPQDDSLSDRADRY